MKRFLKRFGKIAGYAIVYIIITLGTAVGVIFLSSPGAKKGSNSDELYIAPQLSHIYENFTMVKALKINLEAAIETPTDTINLALAADLDMGEGLSSIEAEGSILVFLNDETLQIDFTFADMNLYLELLNGKFVVETDNIGDSLGSLMTLLNVEIPDLGLDLGSLDVDTILSMLSNLEEVKSEDKIILNISVPVVGNLQLVCDLKYNVRSFNLPKTEISEGTTIAVNSDLDYPDQIVVDSPSDPEYINATHLFGVAEALLGYMNEDEIGFDLEFTYNDFTIAGNMSADLNDFASKITLEVLDRPLNLIAQDNIIYLEYGNLNFKFALADSYLVTDLLHKHFGIDVPLNEVIAILTSIKAGNLFDIIGGLDFGGDAAQTETSLSDIDLSIIERFEKLNNVYYLNIRDIGAIEIGVYGKELSSLSFSGFGANANIRVTEPRSLELANAKETYLDIAKLIPVIDAAIETAKYDNFAGTVNIKLSPEFELALDIMLSKADGKLTAHLETSILGQDVIIDVQNSTIYLQIANMKFSASLTEIESLVALAMNSLEITLPEVDTEELLQQVKSLVDPASPAIVKAMTSDETSLTITLFNDLQIAVSYDKTITGAAVTYDDIACELTLAASNDELPFPTINTEEYTTVTQLVELANAVLDYAKTKEYYVDLAFDYDNVGLDTKLGINLKTASAKLSLELLDMPLNLIFQDETFFLEYGNIRAKFAIADLDKVATLLAKQFNINLPMEEIDTVLSAIKTGKVVELLTGFVANSDVQFDPTSIDLGVVERFEKVEDSFFLTIRGVGAVEINVPNGVLNYVNFSGFGANANIAVTDAFDLGLAQAAEEYLDIAELIPVIDAAIETAKYDNFAGTINVTIGEENLTLTLLLTKAEGKFAAHLTTTYLGQNIIVDLVGSNLYLQVSDFKLQASLDDVDTIKDFIQNVIGLTIPETDMNELIDELKQIIDPSVNETLIKAVVKLDNKLAFTLFNDMTIAVQYGETINGFMVDFNNIKVVASLTATSESLEIPAITSSDYAPITDLLSKASSLIGYINSQKYYGEIYLDYEEYNIQGVVNYDETGISAALTACIQDVNIEIKFIKDTIYLTIADIKLEFSLGDIETVMDFVNTNFGIDLSTMLNDLIDELKNSGSQEELNLKELISDLYLAYANDSLTVKLPDVTATVNFNGNNLSSLALAVESLKLNASVIVLSAPTPVEVAGEYMKITDLLPIIEAAKNYLETKQYSIVADAKVYEKKQVTFETKDAQLQLDFADGLQFYGNVVVEGKTDHAMEISIYENYLYVNYNGLLLKMKMTDMQELLVIVMQMFGIDTSFIPSTQASTGLDIDVDAITGLATDLLPNLDISNPLSMVKLIRSISVKNGVLEIVIDGSMISTNERAENMTLQILTNDNKLSGIKLINFYTGVSNEEHFDLDVRFQEFTNVTTPDTSKNYVDLSGSNEIIKAALNMVSFRDFELAGNFSIDMAIPVLSDMHLTLPVNFKVKIVDGKPEVFAAIEKIPVAALTVYDLNNDTNWSDSKVNTVNILTMKSSGETRSLYIYYKDGSMYFYRTEKNSSGDTYEKKLKAPLETVMSDILYYVQWGTGFNDDIIGAIRKSLENEHTIDLGNIIRSFSATANGCTIVLNMTEISGDKNMGDMTIGLGLTDYTSTVNNETKTQKIIGTISFKMNMPFTDSIQLNMQTVDNEPLKLVNVNQPIDFTDFYNFVNNYPYADNVEMEAYSGNWQKASEREFRVAFVTNSPNTEADILGKQGTTFTLPTYENYQVSTATEYDLYEFVGWYTTSNFAAGTEFTEGVIPFNNLTLYAKWNSLESSRTVTYYDYYGNFISSQYAEVGTSLNGIASEYIYEQIGDKLITKQFVGWFDEDGFRITYVPEDSVTLYAQYEVVRTQTEYTLTLDTGIAPAQSPILVFDGNDAGKQLPNYAVDLTIGEKVYQFAGWFLDAEYATEFDGIMPEHDLTIYAKWEEVEGKVLHIIDNGEEICNKTIVPGKAVILPNTVKVDDNTEWYLDQAFTQKTTLPQVMGEEDLTLYIRNKYTVSYTYYVNENGTHIKKDETVSLYQGETFTLPEQNNYEISYDLDRNGEKDKLIAYFFDGYTYNDAKVNGTITVENRDMNFTSNLSTQEADWCKVTFVVEWVVPGGTIGSWWKQKQAPTQIAPVFVLKGASITGVKLSYKDSILDDTLKTKDMNTSCKYSYAVTYTYNAINYNTTGCYNYGTSSGKTSTTAINENITLYVEWDD